MTGLQLARPAWVAPPHHEVVDLIALASISTQDEETPMSTRWACGGMVSAASWTCGLLFGPITHRDEDPLTLDVARAEMLTAATLVYHDRPEQRRGYHRELRQFCASTGVPVRAPVETKRDYVMGAWVTLRWLIGIEASPPIPVPLRHGDGSLLTATEIYAQFLADRQPATELQRRAIQATAEAMAEESRSMARFIRIHEERMEAGQ